MTRIQAKELLVSMGIESPTEEQITTYLNSVNGEVKKEKDKNAQYKDDAEKVKELQAQLDEINNRDLTDLQKAQKDFESAQKEIADLKAQMKKANMQKGLAEKGIVGEDADKFIDSLMQGEFDSESFGKIFDNAKNTAIADYEKKILDDTPNNVGGKSDPDKKSEADMLAENSAKAMGDANTTSANIVSQYM